MTTIYNTQKFKNFTTLCPEYLYILIKELILLKISKNLQQLQLPL